MKKFNLVLLSFFHFVITFSGGILDRSLNVKASAGPIIEKYFHKYCSNFTLSSELLAAYDLKDLGHEPFQSVDAFLDLLMCYVGFATSDTFFHVFYLAQELTLEGQVLSQGWYLISDDVLFCSEFYVGDMDFDLKQTITALLPISQESRARYDLASKRDGFVGIFYFCISKKGEVVAFNSPLEKSLSKQAAETIKKLGRGISIAWNAIFSRSRRYAHAVEVPSE